MTYILCEANFEYNDEDYYQGDGVTPKKSFSSRSAAEKECEKRNIEAFRGLEPYAYCPYSPCNGWEKPVEIEGFYIPDSEEYDWQIPKDADETIIKLYMKAFPELVFWTVVEVED